MHTNRVIRIMAHTVAPKKYGLIVPKKSKVTAVVKKPSVFNDSSSDEEVSGKVKPKFALGSLWRENKKNASKMETQGAVAKALEQDPEVFDYDGQYDKIQEQKRKTNAKLAQRDKSSRYISKLKKVADRRKMEQDIIYERKVQREMEREGLEHEEKDTFLTSAYRLKLEERKQLEAELKMAAEREAADDITKQEDLSKIHRTLLHRMTGGQREEPVTKDSGDGGGGEGEGEGGVGLGGPAEDKSPPGQQGETSGQQGETSGQQGETSGQQGETSGQQGETSGQQLETSGSGQQGETSGQQGETSGQQGETSGQQGETSGPQTEAGADEVSLFPPTVDKAKMRKIAAVKRTSEESLGSAKERFLARKMAKLTTPVISDD